MMKSTFKNILLLFIGWRILLILFSVYSVFFVPVQQQFLGGGIIRNLGNPLIWSWANFDGEHYLSIALHGYKHWEQAFFPVYPILMRLLAIPFSLEDFKLVWTGLVVSNGSIFLAIVLLWKLVRLDYGKDIATLTLIVLLSFPTSFYLGAVYNESLFLLLSVSSFYLARKGKWFSAGVLGAVSSATRIFGVLLLPALFIEAVTKKVSLKRYIWICLIPLGLFLYMLYQKLTVGDAFAFYKLRLLVGEQHQRGIVLLPQVFYRYAKILLSLSPASSIYQTVILELVVGIMFTLLPIYGYFKKMRISYIFYLIAGFLSPTIQGSFSSVPRYVLAFFPAFILIAIFLNNRPSWLRISYLTLSLFWLGIETILFFRGYWVS